MYLYNVQVLFLNYFSNSDKFHPNFMIKVDNFANQNINNMIFQLLSTYPQLS